MGDAREECLMKTRWLALAALGTVLAACGREPVTPEPTTTTVADVLEAEGFSTLLEAVSAAGLGDTLAGEGPFTVFAPTDAAFDALPEGVLAGLLADPEALSEVLSYHVLGAALDAEAITSAGDSFQTTVQGAPVGVTVNDDGVMLNAIATVTQTDLEADNGVVHAIDAVLLPPAEAFSAELSSDNEVIPPDADYDEIESEATGSVTAALDLAAETPTLALTGEFSGLSSPLLPIEGSPAHLHGPADETENAGILFPLSVAGDGQEEPATLSGEFELTPETFGYVVSGLTYINVHTETYPAGEIRGQLLPVAARPIGETTFVAELSSDNEVLTDDLPYDSIESDGTGTVTFTLDPQTLVLTAEGSFEGLSSAPLPIGEGPEATPIHIHEAPAGENGPIAFPLTLETGDDPTSGTISGEATLSEEQVVTLLSEGFYVNLHTETYPGGELRGQIVPLEVNLPDEGL
jgi:uncharacterized surface protein with fasciclin (FAS1) repeats